MHKRLTRPEFKQAKTTRIEAAAWRLHWIQGGSAAHKAQRAGRASLFPLPPHQHRYFLAGGAEDKPFSQEAGSGIGSQDSRSAGGPMEVVHEDQDRGWDGADEEASATPLPTWPACPDTQRGRTVEEAAD